MTSKKINFFFNLKFFNDLLIIVMEMSSPRLHPPPAVRAPRHQARQRSVGRQRTHPAGGLRLVFETQPRRDRAEQRGCGHA